ncbi:MAG: SCO family protein [Pseudomonadota bacterium]
MAASDAQDVPVSGVRLVIAAGVALILVLVGAMLLTTDRGLFKDYAAAPLGGDFTLTSADGPVSLSDFRGQVVLLYFGFLNCPEVCPTSMGIYRQTLKRLDADELSQVQPLLVTIDPARDDPDALDEFGTYYHPSIIGLGGSDADIRAVADQYGAYFKAVPDDGEVEYVFEHTSRYYVIDQSGTLVAAMRHSTTANELLARVRSLL